MEPRMFERVCAEWIEDGKKRRGVGMVVGFGEASGTPIVRLDSGREILATGKIKRPK